jgi:hypothetical protein
MKSEDTSRFPYRSHKTKKKPMEKKSNAVCVGHHYPQANTNNIIRHEPSYKQLEVETNRTSFVCGNHNTEHKA